MSGRRVEGRTWAPPDDLRELVACFWVGRWALRGEAPHTTELLGDPCVHVVFEASDAAREGRVVGVWTRLWRRTLAGDGFVRGAKLRAGAARRLLGSAVSTWSDRITPLEALAGVDARALTDAVLAPDDDVEAFARLSAWVRGAARPDDDGHASLAAALFDRVTRDPSITGVGRLAEVAGLGPRALQRLFREHVGATPKWVIRRHRLQEAALRLERAEAPSLAALAAELGYADQAHFTRDFRASVGRSPRDFAAAVHR